MNLLSRISFRATHSSSNAHLFHSPSHSQQKRRLAGVVAVLFGMAMTGVLAVGQVRPETPGPVHPDAATVARARAAFLKAMSSHRPMVRATAPKRATVAGSSTGTGSYNWSGFADVESGSNRVSKVSGEWVIPQVHCLSGAYRNQDAFLAQWVGIDGFTDGTVEQLGTGTQCYEGVTYYYVWYEMFPAGTVEEGTVACINENVDCPQPGDYITASVTATAAGNYTLSLNDVTRPQESFSVTASCAPATCVDSSAEWIVERPAFDLPFGFQILPLADFSLTGFFDGSLTSGGKTTTIGHFHDGPVYDIAMVDDSASYFLDCNGQTQPGPALLQITDPSACPVVSPTDGSFNATWDSSF